MSMRLVEILGYDLFIIRKHRKNCKFTSWNGKFARATYDIHSIQRSLFSDLHWMKSKLWIYYHAMIFPSFNCVFFICCGCKYHCDHLQWSIMKISKDKVNKDDETNVVYKVCCTPNGSRDASNRFEMHCRNTWISIESVWARERANVWFITIRSVSMSVGCTREGRACNIACGAFQRQGMTNNR